MTSCRAHTTQFTMPVDVAWSKFDTELLGRFWASHAGELADLASIADKVLVYHRGIDTVNCP